MHTKADYRKVLEGLFTLHPNIPLRMDYVIAYMLNELSISPEDYRNTMYDIKKFLQEETGVGSISILHGPNGGVFQAKRLAVSQQAVNDHVCPCCRNERVSKSEKTCWKCGGNLH